MKNSRYFFYFSTLLYLCFTACDNSIMEKWWDEPTDARPVSSVYYIVKFDSNGGEPAPGDQLVANDGKISKIPAMVKKNPDGYPYGFGGWFKEPECVIEWNFATDTVTSDIRLYAKWVDPENHPAHPDFPKSPDPLPEEIFYTIDFQMNGGNAGGGGVDPMHILEGAKIPEPPALRRAVSAGSEIWYGFGGWFKSLSFIGEPWNFAVNTVNGADADSSGVITLYAKWELPPDPPSPSDLPAPSHVLVTFEAEGGIPEPRSQDLIAETSIVEPYAMSRNGYGFGGWYTDAAFINQWNFAVDTVSAQMSHLILYAKWVTTFFTVAFFPNGGSPAPRSQTVAYGTTAAAPPVMRNPGLGFVGWYTDEACTDGNEWNFNTPVTGDINLYAKWGTAHYLVKFDLKLPPSGLPDDLPPSTTGHGNIPTDQDITIGGRIFEPAPENAAGWSFVDWYYSETKLEPKDDEWTPSELATLKPWDFDWVLDEDRIAQVGIQPNVGSSPVVYLYARWVPFDPDMVWVRKGSFTMGGGTGASPARHVRITEGFYIGKYPVTQQQYIDVMTGESGANPDPSQFQANQRTRPVERVSWYDAIQYCIRFTDQTNAATVGLNLTQVYTLANITRQPSPPPTTSVTGSIGSADVTEDWSGNGYRLPTEAEWEYAARGGNGSPGDFTYSGSNNHEDVAWYNTNSGSMTHPVGTKAPNGLGIYDMSGNVSEWCWDWYNSRYYSESGNNVDPKGPVSGSHTTPERVRRGGSWNNAYSNVRNTVRSSEVPASANWVIGFRVVRGVTGMY